MDPISKFLTEQNNFKKLYHISEENLDNKTLIPRVPDNYMTKNGYEDAKIKRVSFCTSIQGCLMALSANISGKVFYVHEPIDYNVRILFNKDIITKKYVPDAHITGETWVLEPIKLKNVMTILVKSAKSKSYEYKLEDKTKKRLYEWNYDVISEFDVINIDKNKYKDNVSKKDYMGKEIIRYNDEKNRKNPETIAYILLSKNEYGHLEVDALYVLDEKYQGRGFGRALMKMYENKAQVLYTEQENHKARGFYEKIGWKNSGITSNFSKEKPNKKWCLYYNPKTISKDKLTTYVSSNVVYHGSPIQNLTTIVPKIGSTHDGKKIQRIYASKDKSYASAFTFEWDDSIASFGQYKGGPWTLKLDKRYKKRLLQPCSLYEISSEGFEKITYAELTSNKPAKVLKEEQYKTSLDCMMKHGVIVKMVDDIPFYEVKKSNISGKGCFAIRNIPEGTAVGLAFTEIKNTGNPDEDYSRTELGAMANHSNKPNLKWTKMLSMYYYTATKDIKIGEEFTIDYNTFPWEGERDFVNND